jgi:hypothetical protein
MNGILIGLLACLSNTFPMNEFEKPSLLNPRIRLISCHIPLTGVDTEVLILGTSPYKDQN